LPLIRFGIMEASTDFLSQFHALKEGFHITLILEECGVDSGRVTRVGRCQRNSSAAFRTQHTGVKTIAMTEVQFAPMIINHGAHHMELYIWGGFAAVYIDKAAALGIISRQHAFAPRLVLEKLTNHPQAAHEGKANIVFNLRVKADDVINMVLQVFAHSREVNFLRNTKLRKLFLCLMR